MAASHVQHKITRSGGVTSVAATFDSNVGAGNAISGMTGWTTAARTLNSVTDSLSNTYTLLHNPTAGSNGNEAALFYSTGITGGACTVTATLDSTSGAFFDIFIHESTGTTLTFDASDLTEGVDLGSGADAWDPACAATFTAGAILNEFAVDGGYGSTWTVGTGYTERQSGSEYMSATQVFAAGGALAAKFTNAGLGEAFIGLIGFKETAAGDPEGSLVGGKLLRGGLLRHGVLTRNA